MVAGESRGSSRWGLQELPDDVLGLLSGVLSPRDVVMLGATCRKFQGACVADKLWLPHCERILSGVDLQSWRGAVNSYQSLWRFARSVQALVGLWVHQNPELGNLVNVTWGFVSVVGCRIIPQEVGPHGLDTGLLWAPVFEIIGNADGLPTVFLHGQENEKEELCYPGRFLLSDPNPNVLLLEVEPLLQHCSSSKKVSLATERSFQGWEADLPSDQMSFHSLGFGDRRRLLELLAPQIALQIPSLAVGSLFPCFRLPEWMHGTKAAYSSNLYTDELTSLTTRRARLMRILNGGRGNKSMNWDSLPDGLRARSFVNPSDFEHSNFCGDNEWLLKALLSSTLSHDSSRVPGKHNGLSAESRPNGSANLFGKKGARIDHAPSVSATSANGFVPPKKQGLSRLVVSKMKHMMGLRRSDNVVKVKTSSSNTEAKRVLLQEFLKQSKSVGLRLHASSWNLNSYRAWPIMQNNHFALYKIPQQLPSEGMEYAGIWGGTFGWPPESSTTQDKFGKALFFLKVSYEDTSEGRVLIATKILEGTQYVRHPNGSAMFTAKVDETSSTVFPRDNDLAGHPLDILHCFPGEGIAHGYGFRYPGSKPGDLFVDRAGSLLFVWKESRAVLALRRLDLQALLENGRRVPVLPPVANFSYLTKSYSNVFAGSRGHSAIAANCTPGMRSSALLSASLSRQD